MMDMGINSALTLLQLRDVTLARAEEEISREIILRLPRAEHNVETLVAYAKVKHQPPAPEHLGGSPSPSLASIEFLPNSE